MEETLISLAAETISRTELEAASEFLLSGRRLTKAEVTKEFEQRFAEKLDVDYAVFVNSGSSANLLMAAALLESGRLRNNKVVCPAVSWVTTVTPFIQLGFEVSLCDADADNLGVDLHHLEKLFASEEPSVLIIVHVLGHPNHTREIRRLCDEYGVILLEDACEALGSQDENGKNLGTISLAGSYSFYYGHHISTIEGGMVVTDDFDLYQLMISMRSHGWSRDLDPARRQDLVEEFRVDRFQDLYTFYHPGFNFRPTDFQSFIGLGQLERVDEIAHRRREIHEIYRAGLPQFWTQKSRSVSLSPFAYGLAVDNRTELAEELEQEGIESRPLICGNIGRHPFWIRRYGEMRLPVADWIHEFGIYLPIHASLTNQEVRLVVEAVKKWGVPTKTG